MDDEALKTQINALAKKVATWDRSTIKGLLKHGGEFYTLDSETAAAILKALGNIELNDAIPSAKALVLANKVTTWDTTTIKGLLKHVDNFDDLASETAAAILKALGNIELNDAIPSAKVLILANKVTTWNESSITGLLKHGGEFDTLDSETAAAILKALGNIELNDAIPSAKVLILANKVTTWNESSITGLLKHGGEFYTLAAETAAAILEALANIELNDAIPSAKVLILANKVTTWNESSITGLLKHGGEFDGLASETAAATLKALGNIELNDAIPSAKVLILANKVTTWKESSITGLLKHVDNFDGLASEAAAATLKALGNIELNDAIPSAKVLILANKVTTWNESSITGLLKHGGEFDTLDSETAAAILEALGNIEPTYDVNLKAQIIALAKKVTTWDATTIKGLLKHVDNFDDLASETAAAILKALGNIELNDAIPSAKVLILAKKVTTWDATTIKGLLKHVDNFDGLASETAAAILEALGNIDLNDAIPSAKVLILANKVITWNGSTIKGLLKHVDNFDGLASETAAAILEALGNIDLNDAIPSAKVLILANKVITWNGSTIKGLLKHVDNFNGLASETAAAILKALGNIDLNDAIPSAKVLILANKVITWNGSTIKGLLKHVDNFNGLASETAAAILKALGNIDLNDAIPSAKVLILANKVADKNWDGSSITGLLRHGDDLAAFDSAIATTLLEALANIDPKDGIPSAKVLILANKVTTWNTTTVTGLLKHWALNDESTSQHTEFINILIAKALKIAIGNEPKEITKNTFSKLVGLFASIVANKTEGDTTMIPTKIFEKLDAFKHTVNDIGANNIINIAAKVANWSPAAISGFVKYVPTEKEAKPAIAKALDAAAKLAIGTDDGELAATTLIDLITKFNAAYTTITANDKDYKAAIANALKVAVKLEIGTEDENLRTALAALITNFNTAYTEVSAGNAAEKTAIANALKVAVKLKIGTEYGQLPAGTLATLITTFNAACTEDTADGLGSSVEVATLKKLHKSLSSIGDEGFKQTLATFQQKIAAKKEYSPRIVKNDPKILHKLATIRTAALQKKEETDKASFDSGAIITAGVLGTAAAVIGFAFLGPVGLAFGLLGLLGGILLGNLGTASSATKKIDTNTALAKQAQANTIKK